MLEERSVIRVPGNNRNKAPPGETGVVRAHLTRGPPGTVPGSFRDSVLGYLTTARPPPMYTSCSKDCEPEAKSRLFTTGFFRCNTRNKKPFSQKKPLA